MGWFYILLLKTVPWVELIIWIIILLSCFSLDGALRDIRKRGTYYFTNQSFPGRRRWEYNNGYFWFPWTFAPTFLTFLLHCSFEVATLLVIHSSDLVWNDIILKEHFWASTLWHSLLPLNALGQPLVYFITLQQTDKAFVLCSQMRLSDPLYPLCHVIWCFVYNIYSINAFKSNCVLSTASHLSQNEDFIMVIMIHSTFMIRKNLED